MSALFFLLKDDCWHPQVLMYIWSLYRISVVRGFVLLCRHNSNLLTLWSEMSLPWPAQCALLKGFTFLFALIPSCTWENTYHLHPGSLYRQLSYHNILVGRLRTQQQLWIFTRPWTGDSYHVPRSLCITERKQELGWMFWVGLFLKKIILFYLFF